MHPSKEYASFGTAFPCTCNIIVENKVSMNTCTVRSRYFGAHGKALFSLFLTRMFLHSKIGTGIIL